MRGVIDRAAGKKAAARCRLIVDGWQADTRHRPGGRDREREDGAGHAEQRPRGVVDRCDAEKIEGYTQAVSTNTSKGEHQKRASRNSPLIPILC